MEDLTLFLEIIFPSPFYHKVEDRTCIDTPDIKHSLLQNKKADLTRLMAEQSILKQIVKDHTILLEGHLERTFL